MTKAQIVALAKLAVFDELVEAVEAMQAACAEWAAEFTQKKRAMDWGIVNDAYIKASRSIAKAKVARDGKG